MATAMLGTTVVSSLLGHPAVSIDRHSAQLPTNKEGAVKPHRLPVASTRKTYTSASTRVLQLCSAPKPMKLFVSEALALTRWSRIA